MKSGTSFVLLSFIVLLGLFAIGLYIVGAANYTTDEEVSRSTAWFVVKADEHIQNGTVALAQYFELGLKGFYVHTLHGVNEFVSYSQVPDYSTSTISYIFQNCETYGYRSFVLTVIAVIVSFACVGMSITRFFKDSYILCYAHTIMMVLAAVFGIAAIGTFSNLCAQKLFKEYYSIVDDQYYYSSEYEYFTADYRVVYAHGGGTCVAIALSLLLASTLFNYCIYVEPERPPLASENNAAALSEKL